MFGGEWAINDKSTDYEKRKKFNKDKYNFILNEELTIDPFSNTNGIIPNLIMNLFQSYGSYNTNDSITITCSYIQIYNEQVYDLLVDEEENKEEKKKFNLVSRVGRNVAEKPIKQTPLKIKYDKLNGVIIEGVNEIRTPTFYDIFELLRQGEINRKIRQTRRNEMSSRSHTIFIINIQNHKSNVISKIKLCDLAGSERYDSRESYKKLHFSEMCNINKSLLILGNVIHSLGQNNGTVSLSKTKNKKNNKTFAPYKDSKLTQILEDSLGGNSVTYLIANISPCDENFEETISTLKFADRAHSIMTKVSMNQLTSKDDGFKSKEFNKICDELFQLKQLLNIRKKRGTLEPIQEELLKLKDENQQLKKYLGGENNVNRIQELISENNNLRKEIKNLMEMNKSLKNEINSKPISHLSSELNNDNYKNNLSDKKKSNINNNLNNTNSKNKNNDLNIDEYNSTGKSGNKRKTNSTNKEGDKLYILDDMLEYKKDNNQNKKNRYDIDDILVSNDNSNENEDNNKISPKLNKNKKQNSNKNIFLESGKNIIYGTKGSDNEKKNSDEGDDDDFGLDNVNYDDLDLDIDDSDNKYIKNTKSKNTNNSKGVNLKLSKINNAATPYERLHLLDQLELENKKKTQALIDNLTKNQGDI